MNRNALAVLAALGIVVSCGKENTGTSGKAIEYYTNLDACVAELKSMIADYGFESQDNQYHYQNNPSLSGDRLSYTKAIAKVIRFIDSNTLEYSSAVPCCSQSSHMYGSEIIYEEKIYSPKNNLHYEVYYILEDTKIYAYAATNGKLIFGEHIFNLIDGSYIEDGSNTSAALTKKRLGTRTATEIYTDEIIDNATITCDYGFPDHDTKIRVDIKNIKETAIEIFWKPRLWSSYGRSGYTNARHYYDAEPLLLRKADSASSIDETLTIPLSWYKDNIEAKNYSTAATSSHCGIDEKKLYVYINGIQHTITFE